jgi:hypothetical protein
MSTSPIPPAPGATVAAAPAAWETSHFSNLDNATLKKGTRLIWLSTGVDDRLMPNTKATVEMLKTHGFDPVFKESAGGHTSIQLAELPDRVFDAAVSIGRLPPLHEA